MTPIPDPVAIRLRAISLRHLRNFVTVARTGNFRRGAEALAVSQPALSAAIRQLEHRLDVRLFDRTTHGVTLSAIGAALLPHARRLLTTADNAFADMHAVATGGHASVRIGVMPSAVSMVAAAVAAIGSGSINVHLEDGRSDQLAATLALGHHDIVICVAPERPSSFTARLLVEDDMLLVVAPDHPLAAARCQPWSALRGEEIVHFTGGSIGELASATLRQNDLAASQRYRVDQVESLYGLVRHGLAVGLMPRLYADVGHGLGGVALISLVAPLVRRRVMLLHRTELNLEHPVAARFADTLVDSITAQFGPSILNPPSSSAQT